MAKSSQSQHFHFPAVSFTYLSSYALVGAYEVTKLLFLHVIYCFYNYEIMF